MMQTLFFNFNPIITGQEKPFDAMLVNDGVIVDVGEKAIIAAGVPADTKMIDLDGHVIIPGLTDCHIHLINYAASKELTVNLKDIPSLQALTLKTGRFMKQKKIKPGDWVEGWGWNHDLFPEVRMPDRQDLDAISKDHPVKLTRMCYHVYAVNTMALELAGITDRTPDPEGGKIDRDEKGRPTGILRETAMDLVDRVIPPLEDKKVIKSLIRSACEDLASFGYTCVHTDDFSATGNRQTLLDAYLELDKAGELPIDIVLQLIINNPEELNFYIEQGLKSGKRFNRLVVGPVKILGDGSVGSRTAALKEPYSDDPSTNGIMLFSQSKLEIMIRKSFESGFDTAVHAIGDKTQEQALEIYGNNKDLIEKHNYSPSIIHCQVASEKALKMYQEFDIIANFQPIFLHSDWTIALERVGEKRLETSYCWKTFIERGIYCVGSSDAPVESFNPFWNIYAAITRKDLEGNPHGGWLPEQALTREEAITLFTVHPPRLTGEAERRGKLKPGYFADFTVLSDNPLSIPAEEVKNMKALAAYKEGVEIYTA